VGGSDVAGLSSRAISKVGVGSGVGVPCREGEAAASEEANRNTPRAKIMKKNRSRLRAGPERSVGIMIEVFRLLRW